MSATAHIPSIYLPPVNPKFLCTLLSLRTSASVDFLAHDHDVRTLSQPLKHRINSILAECGGVDVVVAVTGEQQLGLGIPPGLKSRLREENTCVAAQIPSA